MTTDAVTAFIVDDEALARRRLQDLAGSVEWLRCVGEAASAKAAIPAIEKSEPDLLFLDVKMPGMSGIEMLAHLQHRPAVIFTTAYDQFAVTAFQLGAVDYLLKPFDMERFVCAAERVRHPVSRQPDIETAARAKEVLSDQPLSRLFLREGPRVVPVVLAAIEWFEACDDYVVVHAGKRTFTIGLRMTDLERRLDQRQFVRIHRSLMVNMDHVLSWEPYDGSRFQLALRSGTSLLTSRQRSRLLRGVGR